MKSVGIDIGTSSIKVVEAVASAKGVQLISFREYPLGANPAFDTAIEVIDILKGLALENDPTRTRMVVGLRQDFISARLKLFPFSDRRKILKSLPFELEEELPLSSDTAIFDARICRYLGNQAEILAVAAPKHRVQAALKQAQDGGIQVSLLSSEGLGFSNCFEGWSSPPPSEPAPQQFEHDTEQTPRSMDAVLQIGHSHTLVLAYEKHRLVGIRSVLWGGKNVAEAISRRYEIPFVEAVSEMRKKAFILLSRSEASYDQILFSDTISNQVKELAREVKISLMEFQTELKGDFASVSITGGFSQVLNLQAFLTQTLEIPVNRVEYLHSLQTSFEKTTGIEAVGGVAIGLAFEGLRKPKNPPIQFLRQEFTKQGEGFVEVWKEWGGTIQVVGVLFLVFMVYGSFRETFSYDLTDKVKEAFKKQAKEVAGLTGKNANEAGIKKYISGQRRRSQEVKDIESALKMNTALDVLMKVTNVTPGNKQINLNIRKLKIEDHQIAVEGVVGKVADAKALESALKGIAKGQVRASLGTPKPGSSEVSFSMAFEVDRNLSTVK